VLYEASLTSQTFYQKMYMKQLNFARQNFKGRMQEE